MNPKSSSLPNGFQGFFFFSTFGTRSTGIRVPEKDIVGIVTCTESVTSRLLGVVGEKEPQPCRRVKSSDSNSQSQV